MHQPPPVHQVFEGNNFVICNFVPRKVDYHPLSIPVPYYHSNVDSDEVMFYCGGDYEARKGSGIGQGSISLHPGGHAHGPQPGAYERSIGAEYFDELAVMVDTFRPLELGEGRPRQRRRRLRLVVVRPRATGGSGDTAPPRRGGARTTEPWYADLVGPFVVQPDQLAPLAAEVARLRVEPVDVAVVVPDGIEAVAAAVKLVDSCEQLRLRSVEVPLGVGRLVDASRVLGPLADPAPAGVRRGPGDPGCSERAVHGPVRRRAAPQAAYRRHDDRHVPDRGPAGRPDRDVRR